MKVKISELPPNFFAMVGGFAVLGGLLLLALALFDGGCH